MSSLDTCECGWKSRSQNPNASSRAAVIHMRKCPLRGGKAVEMMNLPKRGISNEDLGNRGEASVEPPRKVQRLLVVSSRSMRICTVKEGNRLMDCSRWSHCPKNWLKSPLGHLCSLHLLAQYCQRGDQPAPAGFLPFGGTLRPHRILRLQQSPRLTRMYLTRGLNNQWSRSQWQCPHLTCQDPLHTVCHLTGFVSAGSLPPALPLRPTRGNPTTPHRHPSPTPSRMTQYSRWSRCHVWAHHQRQPKG